MSSEVPRARARRGDGATHMAPERPEKEEKGLGAAPARATADVRKEKPRPAANSSPLCLRRRLPRHLPPPYLHHRGTAATTKQNPPFILMYASDRPGTDHRRGGANTVRRRRNWN
ncbi:Os02g0273300 [Oryza sativa Japonica Group]|uniref:Os02g0273300 protein n=1 Tax=Oryza sativa subsp. japonica TaxID=39947 RepID=A0A0P0VHG9_ORYSJ|nr:Os02g0273300 [Oryza sativa Japonica Group]